MLTVRLDAHVVLLIHFDDSEAGQSWMVDGTASTSRCPATRNHSGGKVRYKHFISRRVVEDATVQRTQS